MNKTELHRAALKNDKELVKRELCKTSRLAQDNLGRIPLHHAAIRGNVEIVELLLKVNPYQILIQDKEGFTPEDFMQKGKKLKVKRGERKFASVQEAFNTASMHISAHSAILKLLQGKYNGVAEDVFATIQYRAKEIDPKLVNTFCGSAEICETKTAILTAVMGWGKVLKGLTDRIEIEGKKNCPDEYRTLFIFRAIQFFVKENNLDEAMRVIDACVLEGDDKDQMLLDIVGRVMGLEDEKAATDFTVRLIQYGARFCVGNKKIESDRLLDDDDNRKKVFDALYAKHENEARQKCEELFMTLKLNPEQQVQQRVQKFKKENLKKLYSPTRKSMETLLKDLRTSVKVRYAIDSYFGLKNETYASMDEIPTDRTTVDKNWHKICVSVPILLSKQYPKTVNYFLRNVAGDRDPNTLIDFSAMMLVCGYTDFPKSQLNDNQLISAFSKAARFFLIELENFKYVDVILKTLKPKKELRWAYELATFQELDREKNKDDAIAAMETLLKNGWSFASPYAWYGPIQVCQTANDAERLANAFRRNDKKQAVIWVANATNKKNSVDGLVTNGSKAEIESEKAKIWIDHKTGQNSLIKALTTKFRIRILQMQQSLAAYNPDHFDPQKVKTNAYFKVAVNK